MTALPRVVIAAPASGHGKTTVATGLMAALTRAGHVVSGHKVGPDYIDPGYHALATGRPGRNLDAHLQGSDAIPGLLLHGAQGADIAVIEGVMGLHDGQLGTDGFASTAYVAKLTRSPVVLVVDASHASRSIGAIVAGIAAYDAEVRVEGVIVNKVGSDRHATEVVRSIGLPVLGILGRDDGIVAPSRHLGLVPVAEREDAAAALDRLADNIARRVDLDAVAEIARSAPEVHAAAWDPTAVVAPVSGTPRIALAGGRAFTFRYAETDELLRAAGAEVVEFDPIEDAELPTGITGLYLGGGFPEVHAAAIAANAGMRESVRSAVLDGLPTVAECAGLLYLCRSIDGAPMSGVLDADARMARRLTLAYRTATLPHDAVIGSAGLTATGHEFHRTRLDPVAGTRAAWLLDGEADGFSTETLHASYLHTHWAGAPDFASSFASAAARSSRHVSTTAPPPPRNRQLDLLRHHGDAEKRDTSVDFAVNVYAAERPAWLNEALTESLTSQDYPNPAPAGERLAARHHVAVSEVLPTAGAAEAFTLIARFRAWRRPVVVHPQFTEPDVALRMAGHRPQHVTLAGPAFALEPDRVPEDADLVIVGNPTNPTGVLHPREIIAQLRRPGRLVVIDEAFMDGVPFEPASYAASPTDGVAVIRSLTKLWSIPGIRAGYVVAKSEVIDELREQQTPWSVSNPAIAAMIACSSDKAAAETAHRAATIERDRGYLTDGLTELALPFVASDAPFVLVEGATGLRDRLAANGIGVRRCDTFPGLDGSWIRVAVRPRAMTDVLLDALRAATGKRPA